MVQAEQIGSSFRDPSGCLYKENGVLFRKINACYLPQYKMLKDSGLYKRLVDDGLLISHKDMGDGVIKPDVIPFISYPYEWCFSQLRSAGLLTLRIQELAMEYGMTLKDASAYNIQFIKGKPIFIDTLSFEKYEKGEAWVAYGQFCRHFLAPLALVAYKDVRLGQLLRVYLDGVPLDLASKLLPLRAKLNIGILSHICVHSRAVAKSVKDYNLSLYSLLGIIESLEGTIKSLHWKSGNGWGKYQTTTSYSEIGAQSKRFIVGYLIGKIDSNKVWDFGANNGEYSVLNSGNIVAFDKDYACVEACHRNYKDKLLPLVLDLTNPSPAIGWMNSERLEVWDRGTPDLIMALALLHHLIIGNNLPMNKIVELFAHTKRYLIIEFIPKEDKQVQSMLSSRDDIFNYDQLSFESEFRKEFKILDKVTIADSLRSIYLMEKK